MSRSLWWKFSLYGALLVMIFGAGTFVFQEFLSSYFGDLNSSYLVLIAVVALFLTLLVLLHWLITNPLNKVMREIRFMLTGRPYHKIFFERTDEVGVLAHFFNQISTEFENISLKLKQSNQMQSSMETASQIQRDLLPKQAPQIDGLDLVAKTRFADELGGDCFGFIQKHHRFATYIGDVTGHGLPAALVMVMVNTLLDVFSDVTDDYRQLVINTNKHLKPRIKATMFMTMLMLIWDQEKKSMSFIGAGHEYLFVYRAVLGTVEKIPAGGIALGMVPDNSALIKETDLKLNVGDVVLLFSDGITEARNPEGEMYGENRLQSAFTKYASRYTSAGIIYHIASEFAEFTKEAVQEDDMSIICIKYTGEGVERSEGVEKSTNWQ